MVSDREPPSTVKFYVTETCYHAIAQGVFLLTHTEVGTAVGHEHVEFLEGTLVQQLRDAFTGCVFAFLVLFLNGFLAATEAGFRALVDKLLDFFCLFAHCYCKIYI